MENLVQVPFDIEMAKKITNGEIEGKITTRHGCDVRIVCFDMKSVDQRPIVALVQYKNGLDDYLEELSTFMDDGGYLLGIESDIDLFLKVPEHLTKKQAQDEFKPFDRVLVRDSKFDTWQIDLFSHIGTYDEAYPYVCLNDAWAYCIPYNEQTEHLLRSEEDWEGNK